MARLPLNVDRIPDRGGYRYVAYAKDGYSCRLDREPYTRLWRAYATLTGAYVGSGRTLAEIGAKVAGVPLRINRRGSK
jgi:hypothetical protein